MQEELFEQIKELLSENERFFTKLHKVGKQYEAIDFDESGLYQDEEDAVNARWQKLSKKLEMTLSEALDATDVNVHDRVSPDQYLLSLVFKAEEAPPFTLKIDYSNEGEIFITQ
ncbi:MAG: hypothetical protein U9N52_12095 [Campylobacterota bacterium]|nr:hypothetical protein [Campylobacterota bacterium]